MRFVFRFNVSLNRLSSLFNAIHNGNMSLDGEMVKGTSDNQDDLPFKEPEDVSTIKSDVVEGEAFQSIPEPVIGAAPGTGDLSVLPSQEQDSKNIETNQSQLFGYLQQAMETLRGLNLEGFRQLYPVFLAIFAACLLGLALSLSGNMLQSINQLPLLGGVLQGVMEVVGLVAFARFISINLLRQHKRAELFTRIALLKKELLG